MILQEYDQHFQKPPERILLLPSTTGYDYQRMVQEYPKSEYWAIEKDKNSWVQIVTSNQYTKVLKGDISEVNLLKKTFGIIYLDLMSFFTMSTVSKIARILQQKNEGHRTTIPIVPTKGGIVALTLVQRPGRSANLIDPSSKIMCPSSYMEHVATKLNQVIKRRNESWGKGLVGQHAIRLQPLHAFDYTTHMHMIMCIFKAELPHPKLRR